jgi:hypothetical protein
MMPTMHEELQSAFAAALLPTDGQVPRGVTSPRMPDPAFRFAVYRRNVVAALAGALETRFPASTAIVGVEFFRAMAAAYVRARPPRSPLLLAYGDDLPEFAAAFEPAASLPFVPDVMRIEVARARAYHARDAGAITTADLAAVDASRFAGMRGTLHPAAGLLRSSHPAATIWAMNSGGMDVGAIEPWAAEDVLITRPALQVSTIRLPAGGYTFLSALAEGRTVAAAAELAFAGAPTFELSSILAGLVASGALSSLIDGDPS